MAIQAVVTEAAVPLMLNRNQTVTTRQTTPRSILRLFPDLCIFF